MAKQGKNTHMEHLEDEILNKGVDGGEQAIKILKEMGAFLSGLGGPSLKVTTKWDGAPAVVCGTDPADGKFFVGTKSVFNTRDTKICKSESDVQRLYSGGLAAKLSDAYRYLKDCKIRGVIQGDLMFTDDKRKETIHGKNYITFRPNTITYAAEPNTPLGRDINRARLGIVFHTKYTGDSLQNMKASFNISDGDYTPTAATWIQTATFTDIGRVAAFNGKEKSTYEAAIRRAEGSLKKCGSLLDRIQSGKKPLGYDTEFKKFFNQFVKGGTTIPPVEKTYAAYAYHLGQEFNKAIEKNKTLAAQEKKVSMFVEMIDIMEDDQEAFKMLIASYMNLQVAKNMLVNKMKQVSSLRLFADKGTHYEATNPEGFVAISGATAVKLIDRLEFSKLNFTVPKNWG